MTETTEFSFILKPSEHGIGVFATHDIAKGTFLRLFGDKDTVESGIMNRKKSEVPKLFHDHCLSRGEDLSGPRDFGRMEIGWYLNHSKKSNANHINYDWYAARDIKSGEEILIDYNSLGEPEAEKDKYYHE